MDPSDSLAAQTRARTDRETHEAANDPGEKPTLLVSACLLGTACNHRASDSESPDVLALATSFHLVPVCPEVVGGLSTPRPAAEITGGDGTDVLAGGARVVTVEGRDVSTEFRRGAAEAVALAATSGATRAVLKARSPSCGAGTRYDGTFSGTTVAGHGVTAAALHAAGVEVSSDEDPMPGERAAENSDG